MNNKSILQIAETYMRMVQSPPSPFPPQDPPTQPSPPPPLDPVKPQFPPQDPPPPKPLPPVKNKKKKVNEKTSNPVFGIASTYQRLVEAAPPMMLPEPMEDIDTFDPNVRSNDDFRRNVLQQLTFKDYTQFNNYERALRQCYLNPGSCSEIEIAQYEEWIRQYLARLQYYQGQ